MAIINIPVGGGTFTANSGDVFNIPAGATGDITINGATDFTVNILGDLTGGGGDNLRLLQFGTDSQPTVNIPAGVDSSPYAIDTNGENLTVIIGDGATVGNIDGSNLNATGTMTVSAGSTVTVQGSVDNLGPADANISFGAGANISGSVSGSAGGSATLNFGDNATIGGGVTGATGSNTDQTSSITFGNGATVTGPITSDHLYGEAALTMGDNANVTGTINLAGGADATSTAVLTLGDNAVVGGNITGSGQADTFVIGDNWDLANINLLLGDDTLNIGTQSASAGLTQIDGGNPNGSDTDLIRIGVRPDQQAAFDAAGWINNGDGTYSSPGPDFSGSPVTAGNLSVRDFEGAAGLPPDGVVDGEETGENMDLGYDDSTGVTDGGGDQHRRR